MRCLSTAWGCFANKHHAPLILRQRGVSQGLIAAVHRPFSSSCSTVRRCVQTPSLLRVDGGVLRSFHCISPIHRAPLGSPVMYQCGECAKSFRLLNALSHHIMTKHAGKAKAMMMKDGKLEAVSATSPSSTSATPSSRPVMTGSPSASPSGMSFPGMPLAAAPFGGNAAGTVPPASSTATASGGQAAEADEAGTEDDKKNAFVCTICQKTFRLEAALQHHYLAKHNMSAPSTSAEGAAKDAVKDSTAVMEDATKTPLNAVEYVHQQETELPNAPQYHLDFAPNAPEEGDIAVHWRCVNSCTVMGAVSDVKDGYVFEERVLQFTVATTFESPSPGDPDKDFHLVRVYDESVWQPLKEQIKEGDVVLATGQLRLIPQYDAALRKYYHYPVVQVHPGSGMATKTSF